MIAPPRPVSPNFRLVRSHPRAVRLLAWLASVFVFSVAPLRAQAEVRELRDVEYLEPGRTEKLDLYLPASPASKPRPGVVWIHGGGWAGGDKRDGREIAVSRELARAGYVVASINYRLSTPEQPSWPQVLLDCKNAVRFLRARAAEHRVDPGRIAVMGGSAGGHLALMVAFTTGHPGLEPEAPYPGVSSRVGAVADFYGITHLPTWQHTDKEGNPRGGLVDRSSTRLLGASLADDPELWRLASPVSHVRPGIPPVFITHGKKDATVYFGQAVELAEALARENIPHEFVPLESAGHTYNLTTWGKVPLELDLRPPLLAFLDRHLAIAP